MDTIKNKRLHFAFCVNDDYLPYVTVVIRSILLACGKHNCSIYVISDKLSNKNLTRLKSTTEGFTTIDVKVILVDKETLSGVQTGHWTIYSWFRILLPDLLPRSVDRVLYLDADTLVLDDLYDLFVMDMNETPIAGCLDPQNYLDDTYLRCGYHRSLGYICSGVLLMNLSLWRDLRLKDRILLYARNNPQIRFPDQDSINYVCRNNKLILPLRYGIMEWFLAFDEAKGRISIEERRELLERPAIIHFTGNNPWKKEFSGHLFHDDWIRINNGLPRPVKRKYDTKGWPFLKMMVWKMLFSKTRIKKWPTKKTLLAALNHDA